MKDDSIRFVSFVCTVAVFAVVVFSFIIGSFLTHEDIWESLEKAGISRLIEHETKVDGKVTTNWVEIVWKDDIKKCVEH